METNKRIYYVLMAIAALVVVLTALSCIVITDGSLLYTLAIAIPVAVVLAVVAMILHLYPNLTDHPRRKKKSNREPFVPDPMGFRWITAGAASLSFALLLLLVALALMDIISWGTFAAGALLVLAATYGIALYIAVRIRNIAGRPVKKRLAWDIVLEALDIVAGFFFSN